MADWLHPTNEMQEGRHAGRMDRNREVEELENDVQGLEEEKDELEERVAWLRKMVCASCSLDTELVDGHHVDDAGKPFPCDAEPEEN